MKKWPSAVALLAVPAIASAQSPPPILDVHLHALPANSQGPPPLALCLPVTSWGAATSGSSWDAEFLRGLKEPTCSDPIWSPETDEALMEETVDLMERRNVIGVTSGVRRQMWQERVPGRIIPGSRVLFNGGPRSIPLDVLRGQFADGFVQVFAEVTTQYLGIEPADSAVAPYFALAAEMDIPVGIHMGPGPPGAPYLFAPNYRARLHSPLLLEDLLARHPDLRLYVMHAGWPMLDDLIALMWAHPQVYAGLGVISYALPPSEFHRYLRRLVEAGFGERVMFGSDHMVWPGALEFAIQNIESADYLSEPQKRDILYNNAARFLRLTEAQIAEHHSN